MALYEKETLEQNGKEKRAFNIGKLLIWSSISSEFSTKWKKITDSSKYISDSQV